jgi:hypothetical protein
MHFYDTGLCLELDTVKLTPSIWHLIYILYVRFLRQVLSWFPSTSCTYFLSLWIKTIANQSLDIEHPAIWRHSALFQHTLYSTVSQITSHLRPTSHYALLTPVTAQLLTRTCDVHRLSYA